MSYSAGSQSTTKKAERGACDWSFPMAFRGSTTLWHLDLGLPASGTGGDKLLLFKSPSMLYCVIIVLGNKYTGWLEEKSTLFSSPIPTCSSLCVSTWRLFLSPPGISLLCSYWGKGRGHQVLFDGCRCKMQFLVAWQTLKATSCFWEGTREGSVLFSVRNQIG